jgi:hypothetical protein
MGREIEEDEEGEGEARRRRTICLMFNVYCVPTLLLLLYVRTLVLSGASLTSTAAYVYTHSIQRT